MVRRSVVKAARPNRPRQAIDDGEDGEAEEHRRPGPLPRVEPGDQIFGEIRLERKIGLETEPHPPESVHHLRRHGVAVAEEDQAGPGPVIAEDERLDLVAGGADPGVLDDADDGGRDEVLPVHSHLHRLADRQARLGVAELHRRPPVDDDIDSAIEEFRSDFRRCRGGAEDLVLRMALVEKPPRQEAHAHGREEIGIDPVEADVDRRRLLGRPGGDDRLVGRGDPETGEPDRGHSGDSQRFALEGVVARGEPAGALHLDQALALVARVDRLDEPGLGIDDRGAHDQPDRDGELGDDQDVAQGRRPLRLGGGCVRLQNGRRLETREIQRRVEPAERPHQRRQRQHRDEEAVGAEIAEAQVGVEEGAEPGRGQLDQGQSDQHRHSDEQQRFAEKLGDELAARGAEHLAQSHFSRPLPRAGGGEVDEVDAGHDQDQGRDDREGEHGAVVVARAQRAELRLAEMDVGHVDQLQVHDVGAGRGPPLHDLGRDNFLFPGGKGRVDALDIGAGTQLDVVELVHRAPALEGGRNAVP